MQKGDAGMVRAPWFGKRSGAIGRATKRRPRLTARVEHLEERQVLSAGVLRVQLGPLVAIAPGPSQFASSNADNRTGQAGRVTLNSQVEDYVAVNPTNPKNVVAIWQQDRWNNGGARGLGVGVSTDGGTTWKTTKIPNTTQVTGGTYQRTTDPWISFGPTGTLFANNELFNGNETTSFFGNEMAATRSTDGGLTWGAPVPSTINTNLNFFDDKSTITADPKNPNNVYAVWSHINLNDKQQNGGAIDFTRSTDGGLTWSPARIIADYGPTRQTVGNQIIVTPQGTLIDVFALTVSVKNNPTQGHAIGQLIFSNDHGQTWSKPVTISQFLSRSTLTKDGTGVYDPQSGAPLRAIGFLPSVAIDPRNGHIYAVWQDTRFSGGKHAPVSKLFDQIAFSASSDGGRTWSKPIKINKTPTGLPLPIGDQQAFLPSIAVAADGTVAVTYFDFRKNNAGPALNTDYWAVFFKPGRGGQITNPADWGNEVGLTPTSFNALLAPNTNGGGNASGFFLGDYMGLKAAGNSFYSVFSDTNTTTNTAGVFFRKITVS
jgi:hypothetical protein